MDSELRQKIDAFIRQRGLRKTIQREAIIQAAFSTGQHFTAEELIDMARRIEPTVSRATVYRTLPLLVEGGMLKAVDVDKGHQTYDPNFARKPHHCHIVCVDCGRVIEFEDHYLETLQDCIAKRLGFTPVAKSVRIEASCDKKNCKHRK